MREVYQQREVLLATIKKIEAKLESGDEKEILHAVAVTKKLTQLFPQRPEAWNTSGHLLLLASKALRDRNSDMARKLLDECLCIRYKALELTPNCIYGWVQLLDLLEIMDLDERAFWELQKAIRLKDADDPKMHHLIGLPNMDSPALTHRVNIAYDILSNHKARLWPKHMEFVCSVTDSDDRMKRASCLSEIYSKEFHSFYIQAHLTLLFVYDKFSDEHAAKSLIREALTAANEAANVHPTSVLICLFKAKVMFLLGDYAEADIECHRGLAIECPSDPNDDRIAFEHAIEPEGHTYQERVSYVHEKLEKLLNSISCRLKEFWSTLRPCDKGKLWCPILMKLCCSAKRKNNQMRHILLSCN